MEKADCKECDGRGYIDGKVCKDCRGTGDVRKHPPIVTTVEKEKAKQRKRYPGLDRKGR